MEKNMRIKYLKNVEVRLREHYRYDKLPLNYFTLQNGDVSIKKMLPSSMEKANEIAGTNLPVQKKDLVPELVKLRKYYYFDRIPKHWIIIRKPLPGLNSVIQKTKSFVTNDIKIPIESPEQTKETVNFLRKFYLFKRLNNTFFTNSQIINFSILDRRKLIIEKVKHEYTAVKLPDPADYYNF
jgi:hypothetical protein